MSGHPCPAAVKGEVGSKAKSFPFPSDALTDCYRWHGDDEVDDRPVRKPKEEGMMNIAASFSLTKKPRFIKPVGKSQTQEGDAF
jgi:hypothetical protein